MHRHRSTKQIVHAGLRPAAVAGLAVVGTVCGDATAPPRVAPNMLTYAELRIGLGHDI